MIPKLELQQNALEDLLKHTFLGPGQRIFEICISIKIPSDADAVMGTTLCEPPGYPKFTCLAVSSLFSSKWLGSNLGTFPVKRVKAEPSLLEVC